jgi:integrase
MAIRKSKDKSRKLPWCCELNWTDKRTGEKHRETKWFRLEKEAKAHETEMRPKMLDGSLVANKDTCTIGEAIGVWLEDCELRWRTGKKLTLGSLKRYQFTCRKHIIPALGRVMLNDPNVAQECQRFLDALLLKGYRATVQCAAVVLKQTFMLAVKRRLLVHNPLNDEPLQYGEQGKRTTMLEMHELEALFEAAATRHYDERPYVVENRLAAILLATLVSGMRLGEICGLCWDCVDWQHSKIFIRRQWTRHEGLVERAKTKAGIRSQDMPPEVRTVLGWIWERQGRPKEGLVLVGNTGETIFRSLGKAYFLTAMRRAGLVNERGRPKCRFHDLRHAYVSLQHARGSSWLEIAKAVGHSRASITMDRYAHLFEDNKNVAEAARAIASDLVPEKLMLAAPAVPKRDRSKKAQCD